jgi:hypothetical protein
VSELGENGYMLQQFNNPDNPKVCVPTCFLIFYTAWRCTVSISSLTFELANSSFVARFCELCSCNLSHGTFKFSIAILKVHHKGCIVFATY